MLLGFLKNKMRGKIIKGIGKGKDLGYPTVNIDIPVDFKYEFGVYSANVFVGDEKYLGALFYGTRGIFGIEKPSLEIYLIDFEGEIGDYEIDFEIGNKVRDVRKFDSIEELKKAISDDVEIIKNNKNE